MAQIIDFNTAKTTSTKTTNTPAPQSKCNVLDLSDLGLNVLEAIAEAALREHHRCPTSVIDELNKRATDYAAKAKAFSDKVSKRRSSERLDKLLLQTMKFPSHVRARIDHGIAKSGHDIHKRLFLLDEDYKTRTARQSFPDIAQLAGELAMDIRFTNEAKHCVYMSQQYAGLAKQFAEGRIVTRTAHGVESRTYSREE